MRDERMTPTGLELARQSSSFGGAAVCAANINALGPDSGPNEPELVEVIDAWPSLPEAVRADVLDKVRQAQTDPPADTCRP